MAKKPKAKPKLDIKEVMSALDTNDKDFYSRLTEEQKKEFSPWLVMRWASSVGGNYSDYYLIMVNDLVNENFNDFKHHPELQWKLLSLCGVGFKQYHQFIRPPKGRTKSKIQKFLLEVYPTAKYSDLELIESINTVDELKELAKDHGYDDKQIKELFK